MKLGTLVPNFSKELLQHQDIYSTLLALTGALDANGCFSATSIDPAAARSSEIFTQPMPQGHNTCSKYFMIKANEQTQQSNKRCCRISQKT